jgi:hypothetical protein
LKEKESKRKKEIERYRKRKRKEDRYRKKKKEKETDKTQKEKERARRREREDATKTKTDCFLGRVLCTSMFATRKKVSYLLSATPSCVLLGPFGDQQCQFLLVQQTKICNKIQKQKI